MKKRIAILGTLFLALSISSCNKDEDPINPIPTPTPPSGSTGLTLNSFFSNNIDNMTQTYNVDAGTWTQVKGTNGTKLYIQPNTFVDASGNPVAGNVEVKLLEVLNAGEMALVDVPSTSNGQLLVSGGEIKIDASQNGNELKLAPGMSINVSVPANTPDYNMGLFAPELDANGDFVDWTTADSAGVNDTINIWQDSTGWVYNFDFNQSGLGWMNCDYYYSDPNPKTTISVNMSAPYDNSNTAVYLHIPSINSLAELSDWDGDGVFESYTNSIPIGLSTTIIIISEINGDYYSEFIPITVTLNHTLTGSPTATTQSQLITDLSNL